jgi:hypothetical protein
MIPQYPASDLERIKAISPQVLAEPSAIAKIIDHFPYLDDWKTDYKIRSVHLSLNGEKLTCVDAAVLSYGLLELLFPKLKRRILAIHRRDQKGEECGHAVTLYWTHEGKVGAFSKSSFPGFDHRPATFPDELAIAQSFAESYVKMGFTPLYYGVTTLEEAAQGLDWRFSPTDINELSERLIERYEYSFDVIPADQGPANPESNGK